MVVEELIGKIGFKVDSLAPVEKAINRLDQFRARLRFAARDGGPLEQRLSGLITKGVTPFVAAAIYGSVGLKKFQAGLQQTTALAGRLGPALVRITNRAVGLGQSLGIVNTSLIGTRAGMFGVLAAVTAMGAGFAYMVTKAAAARRELAIFAKTNGTTVPRVDVLGQGLGKLGITSEQTQSAVGKITDQVNDAATSGKSKQLDWLTGMGVYSVEPRGPSKGKRIDPSAVLRAFIGAYIARNAKIEALRKQESDALARGDNRGAAAARSKLTPMEDALSKTEKDSGLGSDFFGRLRMSPSVEDYRRGEVEGASQRPTATRAQDQASNNLAEGTAGTMNRLGGLADAVERLATPRVLSGIDALNAFLDKVAIFGKATGLINVTQEEKGRIPGKDEAYGSMIKQAQTSFESATGMPLMGPQLQSLVDKIYNLFSGAGGGADGAGQDKFNRMMDGFVKYYRQDVIDTMKLTVGQNQPPTITDSGNDNRTISIPVNLGVLEHAAMAAEVQRAIQRATLGIGPTSAKIGATTGAPNSP
jgi:hypothetical protein